MRYSMNSSLCFHFNLFLLSEFSIISWVTSFGISKLLHPPNLQPNTRIYKISHNISSRLSEKPHPATILLKLSTPFKKNVTTKTRQYGYYLLPVRTLQLNLHKRNSLLLPFPLPLAVILFLGIWAVNSSCTLLLASCLTTVPVIRPTKFVIPTAGFIPPQTGS